MQKLRSLFLGFCIINLFQLQAQPILNLVSNPSFEAYSSCPVTFNQLKKCLNWFDPAIYSSPDYFNACAAFSTGVNTPNSYYGSQIPKTGQAYAGYAAYIKENYPQEYVGCKITSQLQATKVYCVTYNVSLAEISRFAIRNLGFYLSKDSIYNHFPPPSTLQILLNPSFEVTSGNAFSDTLNWMQVRGTYIANGTENFLSIGNFRDTANTFKQLIKPLLNFPPDLNGAYYYIDDVSLVEINPAKAYSVKTLTVCANTTFTLGADSTEEATYQWQPPAGLSCTNCPNPVVTVITSKKYYLTKQQCSATTKDSVFINVYTPTLSAKGGIFQSTCGNQTFTLGTNDTTAFTNYSWQPFTGLSCTNCPQPVANPFSTTTYTLNKTECAFNTKDTVTIYVEDCEIKIPDIFTPNNDNANDEWKLKLPMAFNFKSVAVFNRWGTLVYNIDDSVLNSENSRVRVIHWDGRTTAGIECSDGVYFYILQYTDNVGNLQKRKGNITLLR